MNLGVACPKEELVVYTALLEKNGEWLCTSYLPGGLNKGILHISNKGVV